MSPLQPRGFPARCLGCTARATTRGATAPVDHASWEGAQDAAFAVEAGEGAAAGRRSGARRARPPTDAGRTRPSGGGLCAA